MRYAVLTFDDGYIEHYEIAKMLYKMDIVATFFIITGLTQYRGRRLLTTRPELIREMADMGHEIGSHTVSHRDLTELSIEEVEREVSESKRKLEEVAKREVGGIAYPYGSFNDVVVEVVKRYYAYGRTMGRVNRWNDAINPYAIGSMGIRHLPKVPLKLKRARMVVLAMHQEKPPVVKTAVFFLRALGLRFTTLEKALRGAWSAE
ncbi:polysaccharide deacetylase family protein [Thermoproteus tenax]|uniref:Xylanase/chitin deacetylase n=1 Tax=Thermoproteus tenax (strain ATCC 35583 / DSM 2078 / JCM 9277 / NBRC 100435 / Kra 1) TaxID=768679 RepID=G4RKA0_THETK|nr:polysaccharide deacetylase family protein [Thermoproteus tenax]CCC81995.1 xylanase/chitin deacetylase [Thermoproteus tenax Kra 1]